MRRTNVISVRVLTASLFAIGALAGAPFVLANVVSERRFAAGEAGAAEIARMIDAGFIDTEAARVLVGRGNKPIAEETSVWATGPTSDLNVPPDPWRNAYLVNADTDGVMWVVSSGPNGIVDTPFAGASAAHGDDIAVRVR